MPRSRLALVAVTGVFDGPWAYIDGITRATFFVRSLGDGDGVRVDYVERESSTLQHLLLNAGPNTVVMDSWLRYRVSKYQADTGEPTTVEIFPDV